MRKYWQIALTMLFMCWSGGTSATAFYIAPHGDDVTLFMERNAAADIASNAKVVFVLVTTGSFVRNSAGTPVVVGGGVYPDLPALPNGMAPPVAPYYYTREVGNIAAIRTWANSSQVDQWVDDYIDGRAVQKNRIGGNPNIIFYVLRLVDGDAQSNSGLAYLKENSSANPGLTISSVDGGQTYTMAQLKSFISAIVQKEQDGNDTWINIPEYFEGTEVAPAGDFHADHRATGWIVAQALKERTPTRCARTIQWMDYRIVNLGLSINYSSSESAIQNAAWANLNNAMVYAGGPRTDDPNSTNGVAHSKFLGHAYRSPNGTDGVKAYGCN